MQICGINIFEELYFIDIWCTTFRQVFKDFIKWLFQTEIVISVIIVIVAIVLYKLWNKIFNKKNDSEEMEKDLLPKKIHWPFIIGAVILLSFIYLVIQTTNLTCQTINRDQQDTQVSIFSEPPLSNYNEIIDFPNCNFNIIDWPICNFNEKDYPCKYSIVEGDIFFDIAQCAFGNIQKAELIAELYRDKNGSIQTLLPDTFVIIPNSDHLDYEEYHSYYFSLLEIPIAECEKDSLSFPCWYRSERESYEFLANLYPSSIKVNCVHAANKTEYSRELHQLIPKTIENGTIVVLPVCE